jgi:hypothetical protein
VGYYFAPTSKILSVVILFLLFKGLGREKAAKAQATLQTFKQGERP